MSDGPNPQEPLSMAPLDREAGRAALRELGKVVDEILARTGLIEDELVRELGGD